MKNGNYDITRILDEIFKSMGASGMTVTSQTRTSFSEVRKHLTNLEVFVRLEDMRHQKMHE